MRTMIMGTVYDTDRAEPLLYKKWCTHHPNISGGLPTCEHERGIYRGRNGGLFAYLRDDTGYGRDSNGVSGTFYKTHREIEALDNPQEALFWCEYWAFDVADIERHFGEVMDEA